MTLVGMTVCSGIGAPEISAPWIDWKYQSEIEPFPCAVLKERFPGAVNLGDMTKFKEWPDATVDVLCGGTPCQSFSVAGLRKGLADPRGNLMLTYLAIADRYRPRWLVWENVPGVLSSDRGRDFGTFLGGLGELGYGFAYRVLDAQYTRTRGFPHAVPQRRRRVFVVGYLGDWRRAAAVLFDGESLRGNPAPRRKTGQAAPTIPARSTGGGGLGTDLDGGLVPDIAGCLNSAGGRAVPGNSIQDADQGYLLPVTNSGQGGGCSLPPVSMSLNAHGARLDAESETLLPMTGGGFDVAHSLRGEGFDASEDGSGRGTPLVPGAFGAQNSSAQGDDVCHEHSPPLSCTRTPAVSFEPYTITERGRNGVQSLEYRQDGTANAILTPNGGRAGMGVGAIAQPWAVRRLTPVECERLQGFPDGWTQIPYRNKTPENCPDGPRYKALGNSWAVNCGQFVFDRIRMVEEMEC